MQILSCKQYNETQINVFRAFTSAPVDTYSDRIDLVPCQNGWDYDNSTYLDSLVTEFNLVCDEQSWVEISTTSFYVGSFIGNCLFGYIADKFGRRRSFFVILIVLVVCGTANSFAKDIESFIILRFFTGLAFPALFQIPFIICMEFMGNSGRIFSGLMISLFFGAAMALLGVVAMFIRRWRQLTFFCNAPFATLFCYYFFLPESPRWSVSVGKWSEAKDQLKKIAKMNGKKEVDVDGLVDSKVIGHPRDASSNDYKKVCAIYHCSQCMHQNFDDLIIKDKIDLRNPVVTNAPSRDSDCTDRLGICPMLKSREMLNCKVMATFCCSSCSAPTTTTTTQETPSDTSLWQRIKSIFQ
uniref:MFS domain-containing protein n=1 Tax=Caenorhabditis tropicalis TaxID=1561998 RepID=A0A1I7THC7_9PELO